MRLDGLSRPGAVERRRLDGGTAQRRIALRGGVRSRLHPAGRGSDSRRRFRRAGPALQEAPPVNELPSGALTRRFLVLCEQYGSQRLAVQVVAVGRSTGVEGLPAGDDWNT